MKRDIEPKRIPQAETGMGRRMPDVVLENRIECSLLDSVSDAYKDSDWGVSFQTVFSRPTTLASDRAIAEQFRPVADGLSGALFRTKYHPSISDGSGWRKPGTLDSFVPFTALGRQAQEVVDMTFLVALQPESPVPPRGEVFIKESDEVHNARQTNRTIQKARLMAELILDTFEEGDLDTIADRTPNPNTALYQRYVAQRDEMRASVAPYMETFEQNLQREFIEGVQGSTSGLALHPEWGYGGGNIGTAYRKLDEYKEEHSSLPWQATSN
jgi:hypothetical protein